LRARGAEHVLLAPSRPPAGQSVHVAEYLLRSLGAFPAAPDDVAARPAASGPAIELPPHVPPAWANDAADAALTTARVAGRPFLVVHPGSGSAAKNWPPERFAALARAVESRLGLPSVMLAGPADDSVVQRLRRAMPVLPPILADLPVPVVAALLLRARGYLGNDSGVAHLAGQLGLPTLVLFGPTDPALWRPLGPRVQVLRAASLAELAVEEVLSALVPLLDG
jgi:ADP-heptose:LPS heptosyltransferase